jgi:hypothetical protein
MINALCTHSNRKLGLKSSMKSPKDSRGQQLHPVTLPWLYYTRTAVTNRRHIPLSTPFLRPHPHRRGNFYVPFSPRTTAPTRRYTDPSSMLCADSLSRHTPSTHRLVKRRVDAIHAAHLRSRSCAVLPCFPTRSLIVAAS